MTNHLTCHPRLLDTLPRGFSNPSAPACTLRCPPPKGKGCFEKPKLFLGNGSKALNQYMRDNFVVFVRSSSDRSTNAVLRYEWLYYKCSRHLPRSTECRGARRS
ncbi:hypothetical protein T265_04265 [Opisthorchis viverrini]|uniref:Uncharacterized protein n=1 Tax=Opisthorchis viverrini TaxID=6198 RepID=A0A074ZPQ5_OPIVI|nr:hypothetical protein T265_04265 [Opisthorchis viverrini]KER29081.1 hypothetical protein T265_04265 [Opisthorchis viverrini]